MHPNISLATIAGIPDLCRSGDTALVSRSRLSCKQIWVSCPELVVTMCKARPEALTERFNPFSKIWMKAFRWKGSFECHLIGFETGGFVRAAAGFFSTAFFTAFGAIARTSALPSKKLVCFSEPGPGLRYYQAQLLKTCTAVMKPAISGKA